MSKQNEWQNAGIFTGAMLLFVLAAYISDCGYFWPSALLMCGIALLLYVLFYMHSRQVVNLGGLLSLFWLGGIGVAGFKLSELSANHWSVTVWTCVLGFYICYVLCYNGLGYFLKMRRMHSAAASADIADIKKHEPAEKMSNHSSKPTGAEPDTGKMRGEDTRTLMALFICILTVTCISTLAFLIEAIVCGYVPALVINTPHAYSYFHVSGVHYFTVSAGFVHPLTLLYLYWKGFLEIQPLKNAVTCNRTEDSNRLKRLDVFKSTIRKLLCQIPWKKPITWILIACNFLAILIPVLCVSRYFLIMAFALTLVTFLAIRRWESLKKTIAMTGICLVILIPAYIVLTVLRGHDVAYLNEIFEMKNSQTPIFVTQPYMYIANNYENFNALVNQLPEFVWGRRMIYPFFALTGLKFAYPDFLVGFIYYTKEELTTLTIIYDAYYDFGTVGVLVFGGALGLVSALVQERIRGNRNPIAYLLYAQLAMYMVLSFFTTWFSNPTTWFWLIATGMMYGFVEIIRRKGPGKSKMQGFRKGD